MRSRFGSRLRRIISRTFVSHDGRNTAVWNNRDVPDDEVLVADRLTALADAECGAVMSPPAAPARPLQPAGGSDRRMRYKTHPLSSCPSVRAARSTRLRRRRTRVAG